MFGVQHHLPFEVCRNAKEATQRGHFYRPPVFKPIQITNVVIVQDGTEAGKPTVDIVLQDESGQKYVVMITAALLKSLPLTFKEGVHGN